MGVRFEGENGAVVEVALGSPCSQAIFAWRDTETTGRWGALMTEEAAQAFADLLADAP